MSNRQPLFCEKAGCCFQKGPFSLFPGKSVILETKTPPCPHNSLPQPATALSSHPNTKQEAQRALHSLTALIDYIIISNERTQRATESTYRPSIRALNALGGASQGVRSGKGHRLRCQTSCSFGALKGLCERIDLSVSPNLEF